MSSSWERPPHTPSWFYTESQHWAEGPSTPQSRTPAAPALLPPSRFCRVQLRSHPGLSPWRTASACLSQATPPLGVFARGPSLCFLQGLPGWCSETQLGHAGGRKPSLSPSHGRGLSNALQSPASQKFVCSFSKSFRIYCAPVLGPREAAVNKRIQNLPALMESTF